MPDIFNGNWLAQLNYIRSAGVKEFKVHIAGSSPDVAYYSLGSAQNVKILADSLHAPDSQLRSLPWGIHISAMIPSLQASKVEIKLFDELQNNQMLDLKIGFNDGLYLVTNQLGMKWKLISAGDFNGFRMIEYHFLGNIPFSELDALITNSPPADGTPNAADKLFTLKQVPIAANQQPNGLKLIEFKASTDSLYAPFGDFTKGTYSFETVGEDGGGGRGQPRNTALKIIIDAEGLETNIEKIRLLDSLNTNAIDLRLTHMNGDVLTIPNDRIGVSTQIDNSGNVDKIRRIKLHAEGSITDFSDSGWDNLWTP